MGDTGDKVILYAAQADAVLKAIGTAAVFPVRSMCAENMGRAALFS